MDIFYFERQREAVFSRLRSLPSCSQLGSGDIKLVVDPIDVSSRLENPSTGLVKAWKKTELQKFTDNVEVPPVYCLNSDEKTKLLETLTPEIRFGASAFYLL